MVILFDFGGTLDADGTRWSVRFHTAYRQAGGRLPFDRFESLFRESDRQLAQVSGIGKAGFLAMLDIQSARLAGLLAEVGETLNADALTGPVYDAAVAVVARNRTVLSRLKDDYRLGIVSNFTGNLDVCLAELELSPFFDIVIDSGKVGMTKPDPRVFRLALASFGSTPTATWMVGDNPTADLLPAAALGLKTCWLTPTEDLRPMPPGVPTARIASLLDLTDVLGLPCTV